MRPGRHSLASATEARRCRGLARCGDCIVNVRRRFLDSGAERSSVLVDDWCAFEGALKPVTLLQLAMASRPLSVWPWPAVASLP